jgi:glycosyltransferase involved in cell wall biosynthesis
MNIILVIYGDIDQVTGGYLYDRKVVEGLRARGVSVQVHALQKRPYVYAPLQGFTRQVRDLVSGGIRNETVQALVVVDELTHPSFFVSLLLRRRPVKHLVTLVHHLRSDERLGPVQRFISKMYEKTLLNRCTLIIVNSSITQDSVRRCLKTDIPVLVCRPGSDTLVQDRFSAAHQQLKVSTEAVHLLNVGNVIPRKGHTTLIEALSSMPELSWRLTIVGKDEPDSRYSRRLHDMIYAAHIKNRISFAGTVDDAELVQLYSDSDLFVFPSFHEGYGIALAEAMRFGLPFVAFDSGGVREICGPIVPVDLNKMDDIHAGKVNAAARGAYEQNRESDGENVLRCRGGFLVRRDSPNNFVLVLSRLIQDGGLRRRLSEEARQRSGELPKWEETGDCFYRALLVAAAGINEKRA